MPKHLEPFKALAPIDWSRVGFGEDEKATGGLGQFLCQTFGDAQTVIESIPVPPSLDRSSSTRRASRRLRSHTDSSVTPATLPLAAHTTPQDPAAADRIRPEWKEVKINPRENPLGISVYKLATKDGRGSWFARRSVHDSLTFERWRLALEREFAESLRVTGKPGGGNIRGIGAERRVEMDVRTGLGRVEVYQLSAQFPGPTTPRDFVTLLLTSDAQRPDEKGMRQFMVVSKPCSHPECPPRPGFIRGQYESVEVIRETPLAQPAKRARSSVDLRRDVALRPTSSDKGRRDLEEAGTSIEWLMVTRSDPGGSVPRFMVEKGTPSGIISDAARFLKWATVKDPKSFAGTEEEGSHSKKEAIESDRQRIQNRARFDKTIGAANTTAATCRTDNTLLGHGAVRQDMDMEDECDGNSHIQNPGGFYSMIASAICAASVAVTSRLPNPFSGTASATLNEEPESGYEDGGEEGEERPTHIITDDDKSSICTFTSAIEPSPASEEPSSAEKGPEKEIKTPPPASIISKGSRASSSLSTATTTQIAAGRSSSSKKFHHEKEMRKLDARRQKLNEKLSRIKTRTAERDAAAREKAEKEALILEAKYQKEVQKLEQKRLAEEKKVQNRVIKQQEKEEKRRLQLELDKVMTERDLARREAEMLKIQVGELQGQNTRLVAHLGRLGVDVQGQV